MKKNTYRALHAVTGVFSVTVALTLPVGEVAAAECAPPVRNSQALQTCLNQAAADAGEKAVRVSGGTWEIDAQVTIPRGVSLQGPGTYGGVVFNIAWQGSLGAPPEEVWDATGITSNYYRSGAVVLECGSAVEGVTFQYPNPSEDDGTGRQRPKKTPPTLSLAKEGNCVAELGRIERNFFDRSYYPVSLLTELESGQPQAVSRAVVRQNRFSQHALGLRVDNCADICKFELNQFGRIGTGDEWDSWIRDNGVAMEIQGVDFVWIADTDVSGYSKGIKFSLGIAAAGGAIMPSPEPTDVHVRNLTCRGCVKGIYSDFEGVIESEIHRLARVVIEGSQIIGKDGSGVERTVVGIELQHADVLSVSGNAFSDIRQFGVYVFDAKWVTIAGNTFNRWSTEPPEKRDAIKCYNCTYASITGNSGRTDIAQCYGIRVTTSSYVTTSANAFDVGASGYALIFNTDTQVRSMGDTGGLGVACSGNCSAPNYQKWP